MKTTSFYPYYAFYLITFFNQIWIPWYKTESVEDKNSIFVYEENIFYDKINFIWMQENNYLSIVVGFINEYQSIFSIPFYFNQFVIYVD